MTVDGRDYAKRNVSGNIDYSPKSPSMDIDDLINETYQEAFEILNSDIKYCEYCGKQIEIKLTQKKVRISTVVKGVVVEKFEVRTVKEYKSRICSTCGGTFCPDCVESSYRGKNTLAVTNTCKICKQKQKEEKIKNCTHNNVKRFIRKDNYFDYYELECLKCGNVKGIAEPIEKIKKEPKPKPSQKSTPQTKPKSQKNGISKILGSMKRIFK
jgi:hypothetical protein